MPSEEIRKGAKHPMSSGQGLSFMGEHPPSKFTEQPYAYCVEAMACCSPMPARRGLAATGRWFFSDGYTMSKSRGRGHALRAQETSPPLLWTLPEDLEHYQNILVRVKAGI